MCPTVVFFFECLIFRAIITLALGVKKRMLISKLGCHDFDTHDS